MKNSYISKNHLSCIKTGLRSLMHDRKSFFSEDDEADNIFRRDYKVLEDAVCALELLEDNWTPVSTPPESGQEVIAYIGNDCYELLTYHIEGDELYDEAAAPDVRYAEADGFYLHEKNDGLIECRRHADIITHWQPLPDRPRKEQNDEVL